MHNMVSIPTPAGSTHNHIPDAMPITNIKWRPAAAGGAGHGNTVLLSTSSEGLIQQWQTSTGKCLHSIKEDNGNMIYALDYAHDGLQFAVAGSDKHVYIYDETTKQLIHAMAEGAHHQPGHANRVFSVKFHPDDTNLLISGGWDRTLQLYDMREGQVVCSIFGPAISGDSLDIFGDMIVTGSNRNKDTVQIFSISRRQLIQNVDWEATAKKDFDAGFSLATKFSKPNPNLIFSGGAGKNEIKIFENNIDGSASMRILGTITDLESPCLCIDAAKNGESILFGLQDGSIYTVGYKIDDDMEGYEGYQGLLNSDRVEEYFAGKELNKPMTHPHKTVTTSEQQSEEMKE